MSFQLSTTSLNIFILILLYRNAYRYSIYRVTERVVAGSFSENSHILNCHAAKLVTQEGIFFANGDDKSNDQKEDSPDPIPDKEPEPEEPKEVQSPQEEVQRPQEEAPRPRSRIETYDEFHRFRDLNRPPDSHYPPGPGPGYRRSNARRCKCSIGLFVSVGLGLL